VDKPRMSRSASIFPVCDELRARMFFRLIGMSVRTVGMRIFLCLLLLCLNSVNVRRSIVINEYMMLEI
jgi:hypothetical protein